MRYRTHIAAFTVAVVLAVSPAAWAQMAAPDEVRRVADNWIALILDHQGHWGGARSAEVIDVQPFRRGQETIGHFCRVKPRGFILVSLRKELAPVKAYSDVSDLDPASEQGLTAALKVKMGGILDWLTAQMGQAVAQADPADVGMFLEFNFLNQWDRLTAEPAAFRDSLQSEAPTADWLEGEALLDDAWHQGVPYNTLCPNMACTQTTNGRAWVGCVALAASEIMRYWGWPPVGEGGGDYDDPAFFEWPNMPRRVTSSSPPQEIGAVSRLCWLVGQAVSMSYGCAGSGASHTDMRAAYRDHFRMHTPILRERTDYSTDGWFHEIREEMSFNKPIQYGIPNHSLVVDGYRELIDGTRQIHLNYGWGFHPNTCWCTLGGIPGGGVNDEDMLTELRPGPAHFTGWIAGPHPKPAFPYRYFTMDHEGIDATFAAGQNLQFLTGKKLVCTSDVAHITIYGAPGDTTRLFSDGNTSEGIRIDHGAVRLHNQGGFIFHPVAAPRYLFATSTTTAGEIELNWVDGYGQEYGFEVERSTGGAFTRIASLGHDVRTYIDSGLVSGAVYLYRVRAYNRKRMYSDYSLVRGARPD